MVIDINTPYRTQRNYKLQGGSWNPQTQGIAHGSAENTMPPPTQIVRDGVVYYSVPVDAGAGNVWTWTWSTMEPNITGSGSNIEIGYEGYTPQDEYSFEDIYGLGQAEPEAIVDKFIADMGLEGLMNRDVLVEELKAMPSMELDKASKALVDESYESDIYGIQKQLGSGRQQVASAAGMSGVRSPSAGGFKGMQDVTEGAYEQMGQATRGYESSIYGLEQDVESKFSQWLNNLLS
jgi:hypothetical protein